jgi:hypothetical protein
MKKSNKKDKRNYLKIILFVIIFIIFLIVVIYLGINYMNVTGNVIDTKLLSQNQMLKDIPKNGEISLQVGEEFYTIRTSSVSLGKSSKPDVSVYIPSSYGTENMDDVCSLFKLANQNKDIKITLNNSKIALLWKYRAMLKYRSCFGI